MNGEGGKGEGRPNRGGGRRAALEPLSHPALVDGSTGLPNRTYFDAVLRVIFALGRRGVPLSVLLLAIDGPGPAGEGDGSQRGDPEEGARAPGFERIVSTLRNATRGGDLFARVDRDVFALLMVDCNAQGAITAADRLREGGRTPSRRRRISGSWLPKRWPTRGAPPPVGSFSRAVRTERIVPTGLPSSTAFPDQTAP